MILLIPTDDVITVAPNFDRVTTFRYMTIINGSIKEDELRRTETNVLEDLLLDIEMNKNLLNPTEISSTLLQGKKEEAKSIGTVITRAISNESEKILHNHHFDIIMTSEHIITNAILDYLKHYATNESDFCCSP